MAEDTNVRGLSELQKFLDTLSPKVERNIMRGALRAGVNVIKPVAQSNINSRSGLLAAGLKVKTKGRWGTVIARLVATGKHAFIARWIEYGTSSHVIEAMRGKMLYFAGRFFQSVLHPGSSPKPFMRPAMDSQATAAVIAVGEYVKNRLATKEGLDTSHIAIEGDDP